jgi:cbb3-type cytochrome oxidase subunit 3
MDVNTLRVLVTVVAMAAFLGIAWWAYLPSRRQRLQDHARRIVEDEGEA